MARALAVAGSRVALTGRSGERARQVAADLPGAIGLPLDVRSESSVAQAVQEAWSRLGGVDMLVNNAGIGMRTVNPGFMTEPQGFWLVSPAGFRDLIETNLTGYFLMAREITPRMLAAGEGRIVNVSVNQATTTRAGFVPYGPSRAGTEAMSRIMAADLRGSGVTVNLLRPGGATAKRPDACSCGIIGLVPELPEVEALATYLTTHAVGHQIVRVDIGSFQVLKTFDPPSSALHGATITGASRRGKFLDIDDIHRIRGCTGSHRRTAACSETAGTGSGASRRLARCA